MFFPSKNIAEYHSVNGQENIQEQADMERQKREGGEKAQEVRSRLLTDCLERKQMICVGII